MNLQFGNFKFLFLFLLVSLQAGPNIAAGLISAEGEVLHVEPSGACEPLIVTATLINAGATTLELNDPEPSCGCTRAETSVTTLEPGETTELYLEIDVPNKPGSELSESVTVSAKDGSLITLPIQGTYEPCALLTEKFITIGDMDIDSGTSITKKIPIELFAATPEVFSFESTTSELTANIEMNKESSNLSLLVSPSKKFGSRNEQIFLYVHGNKFEEISVSWMGISDHFIDLKTPIRFSGAKVRTPITSSITLDVKGNFAVSDAAVVDEDEFSLISYSKETGEVVVSLKAEAAGRTTGSLKVTLRQNWDGKLLEYYIPLVAWVSSN